MTEPALGLHALYERLHGPDPEAARGAARALAGSDPAGVVAVSACLLGERVRYDGGDKLDRRVLARIGGRAVLPLCPEILAGLGCPRAAITITRGDGDALLDGRGAATDERAGDASEALVRGARRAAELAALAGARTAILKERSPSCGLHQIHGPQGLLEGRGTFAAALARAGLALANEAGEP